MKKRKLRFSPSPKRLRELILKNTQQEVSKQEKIVSFQEELRELSVLPLHHNIIIDGELVSVGDRIRDTNNRLDKLLSQT